MSAASRPAPRFLRLKVALVVLASVLALPFVLVALLVGGNAGRR